MKCPNCGANATGKFCASCGATLKALTCTRCSAPLNPGAKFCPTCGAPTHGGAAGPTGRQPTSSVPWMVAGAAVVALLVVLAITQLKTGSPSAQAPQVPAASLGSPVDLSQLSPRDAADRLFNRVMTAYENGAKDTAQFFAPMALQAYGMVDALDADARYHVGLIDLVTDNYAGALAQADTIARTVPGHLYATVLQAEVARARGDSTALRRAQRAFLDHYDAEAKANRPEYAEHPGLLERFRNEALQALGKTP
jgi:hypothetical protein